MQIAASTPAKAVGKEFNATTTLSVAEQLLASVTVTMYVVFTEGFAKGFEILVALNPAEGLHA